VAANQERTESDKPVRGTPAHGPQRSAEGDGDNWQRLDHVIGRVIERARAAFVSGRGKP
jgi:hypothetical protein